MEGIGNIAEELGRRLKKNTFIGLIKERLRVLMEAILFSLCFLKVTYFCIHLNINFVFSELPDYFVKFQIKPLLYLICDNKACLQSTDFCI